MTRETFTHQPDSFWETCYVLVTLQFLSPVNRAACGFALRTLIAGLLALFFCFQLQIDLPLWAPITVWIVAQPAPGMALSKSLYRVVGTLFGAVMGVVALALFPQSPELFVIFFSVYVGGCVFTANMLRNFRGYAAILAAITAVGVAISAQPNPDQVFTIAVARITSTLIGIACAVSMAVLFTRFEAKSQVMTGLRQAVSGAVRRARLLIAATDPAEAEGLEARLIPTLIALETQIEYAAAESAEFRIHSKRAESVVAHLFGLLSASREFRREQRRTGLDLPGALVSATTALLGNAEGFDWPDKLEPIQVELGLLRGSIGQIINKPDISLELQMLLDRLDDCLSHLDGAHSDWSRLLGPWEPEPKLYLEFHRDSRLAFLHGLRAALAVAFVGAFWIVTSWSSGGGVLTITTIVVSLLSTLPRPDLAGLTFLKGTVAACLASFICTFFFLQNIDGNYLFFCLVLGVFLLPATFLTFTPSTVALGLSYCVVFLISTSPTNPMAYNVVTFTNNVLANCFGVLVGVIFYQTVFPADPLANQRHIRGTLLRDALSLGQRPVILAQCAWQSRTYDRINRLMANGTGPASVGEHSFETSVLVLGNNILRLRRLASDHPEFGLPSDAISSAFRCFGKSAWDETSIKVALSKSPLLSDTALPVANVRTRHRIEGCLAEINGFLREYPPASLERRSVHA